MAKIRYIEKEVKYILEKGLKRKGYSLKSFSLSKLRHNSFTEFHCVINKGDVDMNIIIICRINPVTKEIDMSQKVWDILKYVKDNNDRFIFDGNIPKILGYKLNFLD